MHPLQVAVVGCGLIGSRRAREAAQHPGTRLRIVVDTDARRADALAEQYGCAATSRWRTAVDDEAVDVVVVSTPNGLTPEIAEAALAAGKHVLIEKPPGRNLSEARRLAAAAAGGRGLLKVGFNHRYHPAIAAAHAHVVSGSLGAILNIRARYGHGGRPGYEHEWRSNPRLAGGGELLDQGVHLADLLCWFAGQPVEAHAMLQTAVWPIAPLEDNAFALVRFASGAIASLHTSWTQWTNLFSFEVFCESGSVTVEGLGGSYGTERLVVARRAQAGGPPAVDEHVFDGRDDSWRLEWEDFYRAIHSRADLKVGPYNCGSYLGTPDDGVTAMGLIDMIYAAAPLSQRTEASFTQCRLAQ